MGSMNRAVGNAVPRQALRLLSVHVIVSQLYIMHVVNYLTYVRTSAVFMRCVSC